MKANERKVFKSALVLLFIANTLVSTTAIAQDNQPTFGVIDWFPFGWVHEGENNGIIVEVVTAIEETLGVKMKVIVNKIPRVQRDMENGKYDFTISYRDPRLLSNIVNLTDLACLKTGIASLKRRPVNSTNDLNGMRVAYPGGGYFSRSILPTVNVTGVQVAQTQIMYKMALRGRLDAFIINDAIWGAFKAGLFPNQQISESDQGQFAEPFYIEQLPIAISMSASSKHDKLGEQLKSITKNHVFVKRLRETMQKYNIVEALDCLNLPAN